MIEPVRIRYSKTKVVWGLLIGVPFVLMLFVPSSHRDSWLWITYIVLLLLNHLYIFKALFNRGVILTIDDGLGICDSRLGNVHIPWEQIESVTLHHGSRVFLHSDHTSHLGLKESWFSILNKPVSLFGKEGVVIDARGLDIEFDTLAEIIFDRMNPR
jgi:hypothetical protein